jgi:hypothetical protein
MRKVGRFGQAASMHTVSHPLLVVHGTPNGKITVLEHPSSMASLSSGTSITDLVQSIT